MDGAAPCTIAVEGRGLPTDTFAERYVRRRLPVVIRNATAGRARAARFRQLTTIAELASRFGDVNVTLSSANAFSYGRQRVALGEYLSNVTADSAADWASGGARSDEIFYFFGEHGSELAPLLEEYELPAYAAAARDVDAKPAPLAATPSFLRTARPTPVPAEDVREPALSFGVAAGASGVPFHFHNDGFSEVMHGAKRWLLYPGKPPRFRENGTSSAWLEHEYPRLPPRKRPRQCVIGPADLLYFPTGWWHATVNVGITVFMSTFL